MRNRILTYVKNIDLQLEKYETNENNTKEEIDEFIERHLIQTSFFQHERFIHLIVTFLFAILTFGCVLFTVAKFDLAVLGLTILSLILLIPYIYHYYILENNVQYMYKQYDKMLQIKDSK